MDFETRSTVSLPDAGVYRYAEDPTTDIWCLAFAFDDAEPEIWRPGMPLPERIVEHIRAGGECRAWNAQFERVVWRAIMVKRYAAPAIRDEQWVCSAAEAAAMALPRALGQAAQVLSVPQEKDDKGHNLMMRMARPREVLDDGTLIWWDVPERRERLEAYCKQDVRTERAIVKALRRLTPLERAIYLLDQRMNDRGIRCDRDLVLAAQELASIAIGRANARLAQITGGDVTEITNHGRLTAWLTGQGVENEGVAKPAVAALLERDDLPAEAREALELRADAGRSSIAKLATMLTAMCADGMLRGLLLYHAASTGRWAGRLVQPQNFPRGEIGNIETFIEAVLARRYDEIDLYAPVVVVILSMLRSMLTARPGHELLAGDYAAVEARVLNWLAGQEDICDLFRAMDAGDKSKHPYKVMAVRMGRGKTPADIKKPSDDYQAGKAAELGCGFGMGADKFISAAWTVYQVRVNKAEAQAAVNIYRASHARVTDFWKETERACMDAVRRPGEVQVFGARRNLKALVAGSYLYIILPSGRPLIYAAPSIKDRETPWGEMKASLHFWAVHPKTKQWLETGAYGGLLVENIVQAVARDLMAEAMLRLEAAGYLPVLSVHDEIVTEVPTGFGDLKTFEQLMAVTPAWAEGCPVAAEAWQGERYRK